MKKLICTKYLPVTNFKGSRIKAWFADNPKFSKTISFPLELDCQRAHLQAALELSKKMGMASGDGFSLDGNGLTMIEGYGFVVQILPGQPLLHKLS